MRRMLKSSSEICEDPSQFGISLRNTRELLFNEAEEYSEYSPRRHVLAGFRPHPIGAFTSTPQTT
jgi:hypothetical protein